MKPSDSLSPADDANAPSQDRTPSGTLVCPVSREVRPTPASSRCAHSPRRPEDAPEKASLAREVPAHAVLWRRALARVGSTLSGRYRLDGVLGVGGMSTVYAATHVRNGHAVAIKLLHPEIADDRELRERFVREGSVTNGVGHAGTVQVLDDDCSDDGLPYLVMEKLEGETLAQRMARAGRPLSAPEVVRVTTAVLDVLAAAHRSGTVHCDIKPENVFLTTEGAVKVLDFGIARQREEGDAASHDPPPHETTGVCGTPAYMAPERARCDRAGADVRSDIWSVGALAFALLTGRQVHQSRTPQEAMLRAATEQAPRLAATAPGVPRRIAAVIDRALAFSASERWSDAGAMRAAFRSNA